ncbi:hypothetical protein FAZ19_19775 [Sphingobacterium alkalisoli]|uniref:Uncharacterized protein n=1 Tax=Sphingobacterium alkalisoli TaxID=1874115 RepID=A0A4U0GUF5_9SPHI|nr:hypothetical protein [Sphingobacterium alkalisoli]TJY62710.1 hypothetical protein FAZ19_19775 [Sphingobacterium alkalisoli]GGH28356.1 hypothetical protein GCM10011418_38960 [Sphingobacterium alkalisoli]
MKITSQEYIIDAIQEALKTNTTGIGIAMKCDIRREKEYITIEPKRGQTLSFVDVFWLGYFVREYVN